MKLLGDKEEKLQKMSFLISQYNQKGHRYQVTLPQKIILPSKGSLHYQNSMEAISVL